MEDGSPSKSVHLAARGYQNQIMQEMAERDPLVKDQRRKGLARNLMTKYTRELLTKHASSAQNYYFQHSRLSSLLTRKHPAPGELDGSKGLDLNSVYHLSMGIEDETNSIGAFGSFINILRHMLLIPTESGIAGRIWSLIEMFVHQLVMSKDDGRKDIAKIGVEEFKQAFDAKDTPNIKDRHRALDCIFDTLSILFPKLAAGNFDSDPNFQAPSKDLSREPSRARIVREPSKIIPPVSPVAEVPPTPVTIEPLPVTTNEAPELALPAIPSDPTLTSVAPSLSLTSPPPPPPPPPAPPLSKKAAALKPTMKRFNWVKLASHQIHETVYQDEDDAIPRLTVNVRELERKFALKPATSLVVNAGNAQSRTRGAAVLHLLDTKKAQNLGILLTSIRAPSSEIRRAIVSQDFDTLSIGNAISLIKLLPTDDEKAVISANKDDILGKPEMFLLEIMDIPLLRERLEGYVLKKEFEFRVEEATKILEDCSACLSDVQGSTSLKALLRFVLDIGNIMNTGYVDRNGGGAQGFKLASILKLQDTKTSDNKSNLLVHIVEHIEECAPSILEMAYKEIPLLKRGTKEYLQSAQTEVKEMNNQVNALEHAVRNYSPQDDFTFASNAKERLQVLTQQVAAVRSQYVDVARYYGEDSDQDDFIATLLSFCGLLEKTQDDLAFVRLEAEKTTKKAKNKKLNVKEDNTAIKEQSAETGDANTSAGKEENDIKDTTLNIKEEQEGKSNSEISESRLENKQLEKGESELQVEYKLQREIEEADNETTKVLAKVPEEPKREAEIAKEGKDKETETPLPPAPVVNPISPKIDKKENRKQKLMAEILLNIESNNNMKAKRELEYEGKENQVNQQTPTARPQFVRNFTASSPNSLLSPPISPTKTHTPFVPPSPVPSSPSPSSPHKHSPRRKLKPPSLSRIPASYSRSSPALMGLKFEKNEKEDRKEDKKEHKKDKGKKEKKDKSHPISILRFLKK